MLLYGGPPIPKSKRLARAGAYAPYANFLNGESLRLCDLILFRKRRTPWSHRFSLYGGDLFSHSALVFATPATDPGFTKSYVIECNFSGVDITPLERFVQRGNRHIIAVKRLERDWFTDDVKRIVRGHALNYIKADYCFRTFTDLMLRAEAHALFRRQLDGQARARVLSRSLRHGRKLPRAFLSSGFVQYGFFEGIRRALDICGVASDECLGECYFAEGRRSDSFDADLLSVSPQDMADCPTLAWKYLLVGGDVHQVATQDEIRELLRDAGFGIPKFPRPTRATPTQVTAHPEGRARKAWSWLTG